MRIRVPGRFIAVWAILTAFLCLLPASTHVAVARPIGWNDIGPTPPNPQGDNDGVVLKQTSGVAPSVRMAGTGVTATQSKVSPRYDQGGTRLLLMVMKELGYWRFLLRY